MESEIVDLRERDYVLCSIHISKLMHDELIELSDYFSDRGTKWKIGHVMHTALLMFHEEGKLRKLEGNMHDKSERERLLRQYHELHLARLNVSCGNS